jgi:chemotaxis protein CheD
MAEVYHVGMGEIIVAKHPVILTSLGLGSCLGLVIYDEIAKVAGMSHIMLPENHEGREVKKFGKYADTAIPKLIEELIALGALRSRLKAKMAGGAQMFSIPGKNSGSFLAIGERNIEATKKMLSNFGISLVAYDVGGNKGRSVEFYTDNWIMVVKVIGSEVKRI